MAKGTFYVTDEQNSILEENRKTYNLTITKQIKLIIAFVFKNPSTIKKFNEFVEQKTKEY